VADEDVAGDLPDVLEEAEVEVLVLEPRQLQVAVHEGAVGVPVSEVPIVMLPVRRNRHSAVGPDTNFSVSDMLLALSISLQRV